MLMASSRPVNLCPSWPRNVAESCGLSTDSFCYSGGPLSLGREPGGEPRGLIDLMKDKASIVPLSLTILPYISFTTHDPNLCTYLDSAIKIMGKCQLIQAFPPLHPVERLKLQKKEA